MFSLHVTKQTPEWCDLPAVKFTLYFRSRKAAANCYYGNNYLDGYEVRDFGTWGDVEIRLRGFPISEAELMRPRRLTTGPAAGLLCPILNDDPWA